MVQYLNIFILSAKIVTILVFFTHTDLNWLSFMAWVEYIKKMTSNGSEHSVYCFPSQLMICKVDLSMTSPTNCQISRAYWNNAQTIFYSTTRFEFIQSKLFSTTLEIMSLMISGNVVKNQTIHYAQISGEYMKWNKFKIGSTTKWKYYSVVAN